MGQRLLQNTAHLQPRRIATWRFRRASIISSLDGHAEFHDIIRLAFPAENLNPDGRGPCGRVSFWPKVPNSKICRGAVLAWLRSSRARPAATHRPEMEGLGSPEAVESDFVFGLPASAAQWSTSCPSGLLPQPPVCDSPKCDRLIGAELGEQATLHTRHGSSSSPRLGTIVTESLVDEPLGDVAVRTKSSTSSQHSTSHGRKTLADDHHRRAPGRLIALVEAEHGPRHRSCLVLL